MQTTPHRDAHEALSRENEALRAEVRVLSTRMGTAANRVTVALGPTLDALVRLGPYARAVALGLMWGSLCWLLCAASLHFCVGVAILAAYWSRPSRRV